MSDIDYINSSGYTVVDNRVFKLDISHTEFRVLIYLIKWANAHKPLALDIIAEDTKMSRSSVQRALSKLIDKDYVSVVKTSCQGSPNKYKPHPSLTVTRNL